MGRASGQSPAAKSASARRRSKSKRAGTPTLSAEARAFINGTSSSATIRLDPTKVAKGPEFVLGAGNTGAHEKSGRPRHKSERRNSKQSLRRDDH